MFKLTNRLLLTLALPLVAYSWLPRSYSFAQATGVVDDPEAYAVYASILPSEFLSESKRLSHFAILRETRSRLTCQPEESIAPEWRPLWESYKNANAAIQTLLPNFDLGLPYVLVPLEEVRQLLVQAGHDGKTFRGGWSGAYSAFPGRKLLAFSAVGFDASKTRAWVTVQHNCGLSSDHTKLEHDCHGGRHVVLRKDGGVWVQPKNATHCGWAA